MQRLKEERGLSPTLGGAAQELDPHPGLCLDGTVGAHPALHPQPNPQLRDTLALSQLNWEDWNHPQELKMLPQQTKFPRDRTLRTQHLQSSKTTGAILMPFFNITIVFISPASMVCFPNTFRSTSFFV